MTTLEDYKDILLLIPGIGPKTAAKILAEFPSLDDLLSTTPSQIAKQIEGVNKKTAQTLSKYLHTKKKLTQDDNQPQTAKTKSAVRKILNIFYVVLIGLTITVTLLVTFTRYEIFGGYHLFTVLSGSMEPSIQTGGLVLVAPQEQYSIGDVITFTEKPVENLQSPGAVITHRIVGTGRDGATRTFQTKGDANEDPDRLQIAENNIIGKVVFSAPYLGRLINFIGTRAGFFLFIIIPASIIIFGEFKTIFYEIIDIITKRKSKKS